MSPRVIPFHKPSIGEAEIAAVSAVLRSGWLTTGPVTAEFERLFAEHAGAPYAIAVNSCSSGLELALTALGVGPGDEVITSPLTFCATVLAIMHTGATPILADVGPDGNIDLVSVAARITSRTKALLPVHLGGKLCDMESLWRLAREHGLFVVEDAAHALTTLAGSDAAVYSFYATKSLTTGEGGMITTHRADLAERMRRLGYHGISDRDDWRYTVTEPGFKFNLSDVQAALGLEQLKRQDEFLAARRRIAGIYSGELAGVAGLELPADSPWHSWHLYRIGVPSRDEFIRQMKARGVSCSVHFIPIPLHPFFKGESDCPRALEIFSRTVSLPIYPSMSDDDALYVCVCAREVMSCAVPE
jgi:dTDP-4-amino-4,6-dideoxygalactose transaminase